MEAIKAIHCEDQLRFRQLANEARADWITAGLLAGLILAAGLSLLPWWGALIALAGTIGSIQGVSRYSWRASAVRERFCPEASFAATLHACLKECGHAAALLDCGMGYKKEERQKLESKQGLLLPEKLPNPKLRLLSVVPNAASKGHFAFHKNMAVPATSLVQECQSGKCDETLQYTRNESLQIWRHSDGSCLGFNSVHVEVRKMGEHTHALVTGL